MAEEKNLLDSALEWLGLAEEEKPAEAPVDKSKFDGLEMQRFEQASSELATARNAGEDGVELEKSVENAIAAVFERLGLDGKPGIEAMYAAPDVLDGTLLIEVTKELGLDGYEDTGLVSDYISTLHDLNQADKAGIVQNLGPAPTPRNMFDLPSGESINPPPTMTEEKWNKIMEEAAKRAAEGAKTPEQRNIEGILGINGGQKQEFTPQAPKNFDDLFGGKEPWELDPGFAGPAPLETFPEAPQQAEMLEAIRKFLASEEGKKFLKENGLTDGNKQEFSPKAPKELDIVLEDPKLPPRESLVDLNVGGKDPRFNIKPEATDGAAFYIDTPDTSNDTAFYIDTPDTSNDPGFYIDTIGSHEELLKSEAGLAKGQEAKGNGIPGINELGAGGGYNYPDLTDKFTQVAPVVSDTSVAFTKSLEAANNDSFKIAIGKLV